MVSWLESRISARCIWCLALNEISLMFDSRMSDKEDWADAFVRHLINVCKGEIEDVNKLMGIFTKTGWKNLVAKFEEKLGQK